MADFHHKGRCCPFLTEHVAAAVQAERERISAAITAMADAHDQKVGRPIPRTRIALRRTGTSAGLRAAARVALDETEVTDGTR